MLVTEEYSSLHLAFISSVLLTRQFSIAYEIQLLIKYTSHTKFTPNAYMHKAEDDYRVWSGMYY